MIIDDEVRIRNSEREYILRKRGVEDPCKRCSGFGAYAYSHGATWRGGMGTASFQHDVCDECWGSGDALRHGVDLRKMRDEEDTRIAERAVELLADKCGAAIASCRPAIAQMIGVIDKLSNKRYHANDARYLPELSQGLANTLRRAIGVEEVRRWK